MRRRRRMRDTPTMSSKNRNSKSTSIIATMRSSCQVIFRVYRTIAVDQDLAEVFSCHLHTEKIEKSLQRCSTLGPQIKLVFNKLFSFLTLKAPITTAADDKFCDIFQIFEKNMV